MLYISFDLNHTLEGLQKENKISSSMVNVSIFKCNLGWIGDAMHLLPEVLPSPLNDINNDDNIKYQSLMSFNLKDKTRLEKYNPLMMHYYHFMSNSISCVVIISSTN